MSETIDPAAENFSEEDHPGEGGYRLQNEGAPAISQLKDGLADDFMTILLGSVVMKREQWTENLVLHAKDWLSSAAEQALVKESSTASG